MCENCNKPEPGYYAVIPATVRYDKNLSPLTRLLYGEIGALARKEGYCWASNKYFAELYQVDERSIVRWIRDLEKAGHIAVTYETKVKPNDTRYLYIKGDTNVTPSKTSKEKTEEEETTKSLDSSVDSKAKKPPSNKSRVSYTSKNPSSTKSRHPAFSRFEQMAETLVSKLLDADADYFNGRNLDAIRSSWACTFSELGKPPARMQTLLEWCCREANEFWYPRILSADNFCHHYDTLHMQYRQLEQRYGSNNITQRPLTATEVDYGLRVADRLSKAKKA